MKDTFRDSFVGQLIHFSSGENFLPYIEQQPGFVIPPRYLPPGEKLGRTSIPLSPCETLNVPISQCSQGHQNGSVRDSSSQNEASMPATVATSEVTPGTGMRKKASSGPDGAIVVDWYGPEDPENPLNWTTGKKVWLSICIMLMTASIYMGSSIWAPAIPIGAEVFNVSLVASSLGISLFVLGYAIGPLLLSPISEIPLVGRTPPYIITLLIFCVLQIATAYVDEFAGFCVLRFLAGFVGSPPLATGGASLADIFTPDVLTYSFGCYAIAASAAPGLAPVIAGFAIEGTGDWTWAFWEMFFISLFALVVLALLLPETSAETILLRRAIRLRRLTGNCLILAPSEIASHSRSPSAVLRETMLRPLMLTFTEPIIAALNLYVGLIYATIYSFFESFPLVFGSSGYGWTLGLSTLPFLTLMIGSPLSFIGYGLHNKYKFQPLYLKNNGGVRPEARLDMAIPGAILLPISILYLAWSSVRTHWINPVLAITLFGIACDWVFMPALLYLPDAYPRYAASALASNDFVRSVMGAAMPLASQPLFHDLGVAWGNTIIGLCAVLFIPLPFVLIKYGPWLRERSPISIHDSDLNLPTESQSVQTRV